MLILERPIDEVTRYKAALAELKGYITRSAKGEALTQVEENRYGLLALLVADYERRTAPVPPTDPVDALLFLMDQKGLRQADLVPYFGTRSRVSEFISRKRGLTLAQAKKLHQGIGLPLASIFS